MHKIGVTLRILSILLLFPAFGDPYMQNAPSVNEETKRLYEVLSEDKVHPLVLEEESKAASAESKNELVRRIARAFQPGPPGRVLARLPYALTSQNKAEMTTAFLVNLRGREADARASCLYGLEKLEHPDLDSFALISLRDDADIVVAAACQILLPKAKHDSTLWHILQGVYAAHKGDAAFYMSVSLLEAHGIANPAPK